MKAKNVILYILSGILFVSYLAVMAISLDTSRATDAYRLYYVDKKVKYYLSQKDLEKKFCADRKFVFTSDYNPLNLGNGWGDPEPDATWILGKSGDVFVYVTHPERDYRIKLEISQVMSYENDLYINDVLIGKVEPDEQGNVEYQVPAGILTEGVNKITIRTDSEVYPLNYINPDATDNRRLNIYVRSLILSSAPEWSQI
ncbi:MAG: beta galactosidase jelly roll domain-containing protein [Clostridiales bacterium]|nr:beta galactosidase jelly roll domain-containing protein [Clostridiales bacterium]